MQQNKISLVSLVAGAVMFFLPWIEVQCQGRTFIRQTGIQIAAGKFTLGDEFAKGVPKESDEKGSPLGLVVIGAGIFLLLALHAAWSSVRDDADEPEKAGRLSAIALALIVSQMIVGFPVDRALRDELKKSGSAAGSQGKDPLAASMEQQIKTAFQTKPQPALYGCLAALGIPTLVWLNAARRRSGTNSEPTYTS